MRVPMTLLLVVVAVLQSAAGTYLSPGTVFFTYAHQSIATGLRVVYRPSFTESGVNITSFDSMKYCMKFKAGYSNNKASKDEFEFAMNSVLYPYTLYSSMQGDYLYEDVPRLTVIPDTWVLFEVRAYLSKHYQCSRYEKTEYIDTYRFFYVPSEIRYCELDTPRYIYVYPQSNITRCSEVLDGTAEGIVHGVHGVNKPTTVKLPECGSSTKCLSKTASIAIAVSVTCSAVLIIVVILVIAIPRIRRMRAENSIRYDARGQSVGVTVDHTGGADSLLPQYKDLPLKDTPPSYEESSSTAQQT